MKLKAAIGFLFVALSTLAITPYLPFFRSNNLPVTDWASRVVANGGAMPSQNTITCMETLRTTLISMGLTNKIYTLSGFAPDSVIAATTPLFFHKGADPWTNGNFVGGDLTIEGLKGDASTKFLDTAVKAKSGQAVGADGSTGMSVLITESDYNRAAITMGYQDEDTNPRLLLDVSDSGISLWAAGPNSAGDFIFTNDFARVGFVSGNRDDSNNMYLAVASPTESFKSLQSISGAGAGITSTENTIPIFCCRRGSTNSAFSGVRISFAAIHDGFTQTESSNLWFAVKQYRDCIGGGNGNPVTDWNTKVVALGGASVSAGTQTALSNFLVQIDSDQTLYKMISVNAIVPDNLTAARTPIIWQAGNVIWTNVLFGTTNLTVNGLTGNGSNKYLQTGITNFTADNRGFSVASAGISVLMPTNTDTAGNSIVGAQGTNVSQYALFSFASTALFRCWRSTGVNSNLITGSVGTTTNGWLSASRTAANALAIYKARADTSHVLVTNTAITQNGIRFPSSDLYVFALNNAGTASAFNAATLSFVGVHAGLTQTDSSNLYNRVVTLRTALGGGSP